MADLEKDMKLLSVYDAKVRLHAEHLFNIRCRIAAKEDPSMQRALIQVIASAAIKSSYDIHMAQCRLVGQEPPKLADAIRELLDYFVKLADRLERNQSVIDVLKKDAGAAT